MKYFFTVVVLSVCLLCSGQTLKIEAKGKLWGVQNKKTGKWEIPAIYNEIQSVPSYYNADSLLEGFVVRQKNKFLLFNEKARAMPGAIYDSVILLNAYNRVLLKSTGKYFLFDFKAKKKLNVTAYEYVFRYSAESVLMDVFLIVRKDGKSALVNVKNGEMASILADKYYAWWNPGTTRLKYMYVLNGKKGFLNESAQISMQAEHDSVFVFTAENKNNEPVYCSFLDDGKYSFGTADGKMLTEEKFDDLDYRMLMRQDYFYDPSSSVNEILLPVKKNSKWGMINLSGKTVLNFEYDSLIYFEGKDNVMTVKNGLCGIVTLKDQTVKFPFLYGHIDSQWNDYSNKKLCPYYFFTDAKESVGRKGRYNSIYGLCDTTGKIIVKQSGKAIPLKNVYFFKNYEMENFADSTQIGWLWCEGGNKVEVIAGSDTVQHEIEEGVSASVVVVTTADLFEGGKLGILGRNGKFILQPGYDDLMLPIFNQEKALLVGNGYSSMRSKGSWLTCRYTADTTLPIIAKNNGKYGMVSWKGKELIPFDFDSIKYESVSFMQDDNQDSVYKALGDSRYQYNAYIGKKMAIYNKAGKQLMPLTDQYDKICSGLVCSNNDSCAPGCCYRFSNSRAVSLIGRGVKGRRFIYSYTNHEGIDYVTGEVMAIEVQHKYLIPNGGSLNFQDPVLKTNLVKDWFQDFILIGWDFERGIPEVNQYSKTMEVFNRMKRNEGKISEITVSDRELFEPFNLFSIGTLSRCFIQQNNLWYLYDFGSLKRVNELKGFDSVQVIGREFTAWLKGKHQTYPLYYNGPFEPQHSLELEIFDSSAVKRLVCKEGVVYPKFIVNRRDDVEEIDIYGNVIGTKTIIDTIMVPFLSGCKLNIIDANQKYLLKEWADEILFPANKWEERNNLSDTTSASFKGNGNYTSRISAGSDWKYSVAVRYGNKWKLISLSHPEKNTEGYDQIKFNDGLWAAEKNGQTFYFTVQSLTLSKSN